MAINTRQRLGYFNYPIFLVIDPGTKYYILLILLGHPHIFHNL